MAEGVAAMWGGGGGWEGEDGDGEGGRVELRDRLAAEGARDELATKARMATESTAVVDPLPLHLVQVARVRRRRTRLVLRHERLGDVLLHLRLSMSEGRDSDAWPVEALGSGVVFTHSWICFTSNGRGRACPLLVQYHVLAIYWVRGK